MNYLAVKILGDLMGRVYTRIIEPVYVFFVQRSIARAAWRGVRRRGTV
jgi:hypothetical protein